ncbi:MAG TPA: outer membrane protein assembly factor BamD, partial [Pirellulaceae bacterium]|nr:outer membrane protein assembly factor BamD [Pirellulaceae bacterium]
KPWRDTRGNALRVYDKIRIDDPTGKLADDATLAAANAHFIAGSYMKADEYYGDLRKAFPSSEHQFKAHYLGLKTKLLCYQGSDYAGDALDEGEKLVKQIRKQFPREAQDEKEFLARAHAEIRFKKAEREWDMAQYFSRRGEYGAARLYQQLCIDEYHDTPFADRAKQQLAEQASYPAEPPKYFDWLVEMFPREKPAKPLFYSDTPAPKARK